MKKISQIFAYVALGLFALAVLLCSIIKLDFKPEIKVPTYASNGIGIVKVDGDYAENGLNSEEEYNAFIKKYNNSFKLTILYSIFSGKINNKTDITHVSNMTGFEGYKVTFVFDGKQTLIHNNEEIKYTKIMFSVEQDKGLEEKNIWLYAGEEDYYKLTTIANFDQLANYISELSVFN